ncbi:MAG: hypothetical protein CMB99_13475 [Flavobacteriaceae bacterium]|nr:hypothetical protein [Flavobacteriaceae bacterium]|tara:strand:- start:5759 stop:6262 length:504 start_codon:yes stop_codon:yes gene_type:complete
MYKIRIILDTEEDVIRTVLINGSDNLEQLHDFITKSFGFGGQEMASYFRTDHEWNQGEEIPLFDMSDSNTGLSMKSLTIQETLVSPGDRLIYIYDFMNMWAFFVELVEIDPNLPNNGPKVILSVGETPQKAPNKIFTAEKTEMDQDDEFNDDYDNFDEFDDFYGDNY